MHSPEFTVSDESVDGTTQVFAISGELDLFTAPELNERLRAAIRAGKTRIVIDLTETTFIDSVTLATLARTRNRLRPVGGCVVVVCPSGGIKRLFDLTGLKRVFPISDTLEEALAALPPDGSNGAP